MAWEEWDARARFTELLNTTLRDGPQVVTRRGVEIAVLVSIDEWHRLKHVGRPTLKQLLLAPEPRFEIPIDKRGGLSRRQTLESP